METDWEGYGGGGGDDDDRNLLWVTFFPSCHLPRQHSSYQQINDHNMLDSPEGQYHERTMDNLEMTYMRQSTTNLFDSHHMYNELYNTNTILFIISYKL